jgi:hypothetical protein
MWLACQCKPVGTPDYGILAAGHETIGFCFSVFYKPVLLCLIVLIKERDFLKERDFQISLIWLELIMSTNSKL